MNTTDKHELYLKAYQNTLETLTFPEPNLSAIKKLIFYGVRIVNSKPKTKIIIRDEAMRDSRFAENLQWLMGLLTPSEFVNIFPITKYYDGHKYEVKDYFYTRDFIKTLPDKPIGNINEVMEFLWNYENQELLRFVVNYLCNASNLRKLNGQPSIAEEFAVKNGIEVFTTYTDQRGNKFRVSKTTGKCYKVKRKIPRYLKLVVPSRNRGRKERWEQ
ncbi:MAG: hypothetical protein A4E53_04567 [Pelotomaculum sp. PtaB.Bin104]|nr:MAG: hypothetical protein A4E53_04567 [Pelotomaculum sp. PtaB.Bin104]